MPAISKPARSRLSTLVEIEVAYGLAGIGRFFGFADRFLEFLFQQFGGVLLRFHRLLEDGIPPAVLLFHGPCRLFHVVEHFGLDCRGMRYDRLRAGINLQHGIAARARHFKQAGILPHLKRNDTPNCQCAPRRMGRILKRESISQPSKITAPPTVIMARTSPKVMRLGFGSKRFATRLRMFNVAKPKTTAHKML